MAAILVKERYKIVCVLYTDENYACAEAVDILDREKSEWLLNIYEGPALRRYLPRFENMSGCAAFRDMFLDGESLTAVFAPCRGTEIDQVFYKGDSHPWRERMDFAELVLHEALNMADLDPLVSCPAMVSENVFVDLAEKRVRLRFLVAPMEDMNARELVFLTCDQVKKILRPQLFVPGELLDFLDELDRGRCPGVVQLYALWRECSPGIVRGYEALYKKNAFWRFWKALWIRFKRALKRRKRGWATGETG